MKKLVFAAVAVVVACGAFAATAEEKPKKVLMIGNSFSVCVLREMPKVCADLGCKLDLCSMFIGGCSLRTHAENVRNKPPKPYDVTWHYDSLTNQTEVPFRNALGEFHGAKHHSNICDMLVADKWDVVTIQQASHDSPEPPTYYPWADELVQTIRTLAPQAEIVVQETWSYTPFDNRLKDWWKIDQDEMYRRLHEAYYALATKYGLRVIPTGAAVQRYRRELPVVYTDHSLGDDVAGGLTFTQDAATGKWTWKGDPFHLNYKGHFLQALVWTGTLFGVDVTKGAYVPVPLRDRPDHARFIRRIAAETLKARAPVKKPVFLNYDDTHFLHSRGRLGMDVGEKEIRGMLHKYRGTDITDFIFCAGGRVGDVPSKSKESLLDKYDQTVENGQSVCYTNNAVVRLAKQLWRDKKIDMFALWIDEARKCGLRPWLSFRMNDCHGSTEKISFMHPEFYHKHPEYRRIRNRPYAGWFDICYDWTFPAVREREIGYATELMERYDVEGIEVDWLREMFCFVPGRENAAIITDVMRRIRAEADRIGAKRGKRIRIMTRLCTDPEAALALGFDAATWADEGLIDILVVSPRWRTTDSDAPLGLWRRLLRGTKVSILAGLESGLSEGGSNFLCYTPEQLVGFVHVNYSKGADGTYLFNCFDDPCWEDPAKRYIHSGNQPDETLAGFWPNQQKYLPILGQPEKVAAHARDHVITFRDLQPEWKRTTLEPEWNTRDVPFPAEVGPKSPRYFRIPTGPVADDRSLVLRIGISTPDPKLQVFVNGRATAFLRTEACVPKHTTAPLYVFDIDPKEYVEDAAVVEVLAAMPLELTYMDIRVR